MKKAFRFSVVFIILILIVIYVSGLYIFSQYFQPNTKVNGVDVSLTRITDLHKTYNNAYKDFKLNLIERNGKETLKSSSFDYGDELVDGEYVKQNPFYWVITFLVPKNYNLEHNIYFDRDKFVNALNNLNVSKEEVVEPVDAKIIYKDNKFVIENEILGNKINRQKLEQKAIEYVNDRNKNLNLEEEGIYYDPIIKSDDPNLVRKAEEMNNLNSYDITYNFGDRKEVLKNDALISLYSENKDGRLVPDYNKAKEYVRTLAKKYDTFKTTRDFQTTGKGIARIEGGIYGWSTDIDKSAEELVNAMKKQESATIEPAYKLTAESRSQNDIGKSYVEIDIARQHMWLYKDGKMIMDTPVVTGNTSKGNGTPTGVGKIWSREKNRFLSGADYKSHVSYWLPFNWSGCGIHDSDWRSDYGKNIYLTRGSHGCVNTPPALMASFYDNTFKGMPVVVYDSNTQIIQPPAQ